MDERMISLTCVGAVALVSLVDLWLTLPAAGTATRPRPSLDSRCPFCHQALEDGTDRVRCRACGTKHHAGCWAEHQGCSVFACGSLEMLQTPGAPAPPQAEAVERPVEAAADPAG
jgi:hypothetical protein